MKRFLVESKDRQLLGEFEDILEALEFCRGHEGSLVVRVVGDERDDMTYRVKPRQNFTE